MAASSSLPCEALIAVEHGLVDLDDLELFLGLAHLLGELALQRAELLDLRVGDVERVEDLRLGDLVGARLDHQDRLLGAGHDQVEVGGRLGVGEQVGLGRVDDEVAVDLADAHRAHRGGQRDVGDHQRGRGAVHREDVVRVDVVDRERDRHELRVVAPFLREQRADRAVDHARGERALLAGATLALEEGAGDFARGVHALLDIHRQREEIDVAEAACHRGTEDHRVSLADDDGAGGLLGHPAGLKRDLATSDLHGDPRNCVTTHIHCLPVPPVGRRSDSYFSFSERGELSGRLRPTLRRCKAPAEPGAQAAGPSPKASTMPWASRSGPGSTPGFSAS